MQILYEVSEKHRQPGRKVLKPIKDMSSDDTYNGMSDLRQLKLFSFAKSVLNIDGVFLTDDKNLALLWTGLNMTGVSPNEISMTPSKLLFSRADGGELENLFNSL